MEVIRFYDVSKTVKERYLLKNISLFLYQNRTIGLLGPPESGKTVMLDLIMGLSKPSVGSISVNEISPSVECFKFISYLSQKAKLNFRIKLKDLIDVYKEKYNDFDKKKALYLCKKFKLDINKNVQSMNRIQKEVIQLILVISRDVLIYILDEPLSSVDCVYRNTILKFIITNFRKSSTIIISTSNVSGIEEIVDDVVVLKQGKVIIKGSIPNLEKRTRKSFQTIYKDMILD